MLSLFKLKLLLPMNCFRGIKTDAWFNPNPTRGGSCFHTLSACVLPIPSFLSWDESEISLGKHDFDSCLPDNQLRKAVAVVESDVYFDTKFHLNTLNFLRTFYIESTNLA